MDNTNMTKDENNLKQSLGAAIKKRRLELSLEQIDIVDYAEISSKTLSNLEQGKANITLSTLEKIIEVLGMECTLQVKNELAK